MNVTPEQVQNWIAAGFEAAEVQVVGDGRHFEATIVSPQFAGKSQLQRHQLVYAALGTRMQSDIHALSMKTLTPDEI